MRRTLLLPFLLSLASATHGVTVEIYYVVQPGCGMNNGSISANASGGLPPYSYQWNTGATTSTISGLAPGPYSVTVMDGLGNSAQADTVLVMTNNLYLNSTWSVTNSGPDCNGWCMGFLFADVSNMAGTPPYSYAPPPSSDNGSSIFFSGLCNGDVYTVVTDAAGCSGTMSYNTGSETGANMQLITVVSACNGQANGSIAVYVSAQDGASQCISVVNNSVPGSPTQEIFLSNGNAGSVVIDGLVGGSHSLMIIACDDMGDYGCVGSSFDVYVPEFAGPCGTLQGLVYNDADQSCWQAMIEPGLPYRVLTIEPGPYYAVTLSNGTYTANLPVGSYTLAQPLADESQLCPAPEPVPFTITGGPAVTIDLADSSFVQHDLSVLVSTTALRPGFPFTAWIHITNNTPYPSGDVTLSLSYDALLGTVSAIPSASTSSAGLVEWGPTQVGVYSTRYFRASGMVPADIGLLGTQVSFTAMIANTLSETDPLNNIATDTVTITGSYDPNDKQGTTSTGVNATHYYLLQDEWLDYIIRFQNTGTDTAFNVVVRDTIDTDLDIASLQILGASHPFIPYFDAGRTLNFAFNDIQLPDSTTDLPSSQGFVRYRIRPNDDVIVGTLLQNTADIYFDLNPPIITNMVTHVVDFSTGMQAQRREQLRVVPNPATEALTVILAHGSGSMMQLLAANGRVIEVPTMLGSDRAQLDIRSLAPGTYFIRTVSGLACFIKQ